MFKSIWGYRFVLYGVIDVGLMIYSTLHIFAYPLDNAILWMAALMIFGNSGNEHLKMFIRNLENRAIDRLLADARAKAEAARRMGW